MAYCDGGFFLGHRNSPINYKGTTLYFRGERILRANLKFIEEKYSLSKATKLIWTGSSAGAIAAYSWAGYIRDLLRNTAIQYIIDSGILLDFPTMRSKTQYVFQNNIKTLFKFMNN